MPSPNRCNQSAARSPTEEGLLRRVFWAYICARHAAYTLTFGRFRLPRSGLSSRWSSRFRLRRRSDVIRYLADLSPTLIDNPDLSSSQDGPFERGEKLCIFLFKLYRVVPARDSAPPLHVRVPPREFDGLPSAGAAPALWTGTQKPQGTDHPPMNQWKTAPIGERDL